MGRSRHAQHQLEQLRELQGIIASMKTLSQIELHKMGELAREQHAMGKVLEQVAGDFLHFYPRPVMGGEKRLWLLIGAERGFCSDFNEALIQRLMAECPDCTEHPQQVLGVGQKLWAHLEEALPDFVPVHGASVSEELPRVLAQVVTEIQAQLSRQQAGALHLIYHSDGQGGLRSHRLLPPEVRQAVNVGCTPPLLQCKPDDFLADFLPHYLYQGLSEIFTVSLLAENHYRVQHLEGAVRRLDDRLGALTVRARSLRQEEITEEIEMILLGSFM